ncbi:hypothetical protein [Breoghania sp. L-A4]|uniref:hypothetical protein n=1 Tax=Breoghania sp. L-A4 TaxID=2304600 RepID=UPI0013C2C0B9|nr:hypothetical protein [Breoghania sp. L-A4]
MESRTDMPTLTRYLFLLIVLGGCGYGVLYALANFVEPTPRQITVRLPVDRLYR